MESAATPPERQFGAGRRDDNDSNDRLGQEGATAMTAATHLERQFGTGNKRQDIGGDSIDSNDSLGPGLGENDDRNDSLGQE